ncbi:MAG TPA: hypothetical protein VFV38_41670 [Ktedonobacteraceae bacterium]|nr:hypothetical protein [Ktedonobacteraceae bacterium]
MRRPAQNRPDSLTASPSFPDPFGDECSLDTLQISLCISNGLMIYLVGMESILEALTPLEELSETALVVMIGALPRLETFLRCGTIFGFA